MAAFDPERTLPARCLSALMVSAGADSERNLRVKDATVADSELATAIGAAAKSGQLNIENTWVSQRWRYFYMAVNKAASSKIKMVLHQLEGYPLPADPFDVHARNRPGMPFVGKLSAFSASDAVEILKGSDWHRFAFVRNPYERLWSAYKNKIADLASPYIGVREAIWRAAGNRHHPAEAPPFEAFVRYVVRLADPDRDGHWRSQTGALCLDVIDYDFLGRVEKFESDMAAVLRKLGAPGELHGGLDVVAGASARLPAATAYNAALAQLVYEAYGGDFETFGYARDSWRDVAYDGRPEAVENVAGVAKQMETQRAAERARLTIPAAAADVAGLAKAYASPDLGPLAVEREGNTVRFRTRAWTSDVASHHNDDGTVSLVTIDPSIGAFGFEVGETSGKATLTTRDGQHVYEYLATD